MRAVLSSAPLAFALLGAQFARHTLARVAAFDVARLKSQLVATALTCNVREKYKYFVLRFRVNRGWRRSGRCNSTFPAAFGAGGRERQDAYLIQLANTHPRGVFRTVSGTG